jgi:hypothetical protein
MADEGVARKNSRVGLSARSRKREAPTRMPRREPMIVATSSESRRLRIVAPSAGQRSPLELRVASWVIQVDGRGK